MIIPSCGSFNAKIYSNITKSLAVTNLVKKDNSNDVAQKLFM